MRYIVIGFIVMVSVVGSKLFLAFFIDDVNRYNITSSKAQEQAEQLTTIGKSLYLIHCTSCHGKNGEGNNGKAQDHTHRIAKKSVLHVIKNGANNFKSLYPSGMPGGLINDKEAEEVAQFVSGGMAGEKPKAWSLCATCHDESGEGIAFVAPNLKHYSDTFVKGVLSNGKKGAIGTMPSFNNRLSEFQMRSLAHYIRSIQK